MAFTGRTPESLIPRSDSRNPATTCKGITKSGRPCRRPIDAKASQDEGVLAVVSVISDEDDEEIGAAAYFCWQHKDQAEQLAAQQSSGTQLYPLKERNSIDTLVERLGVLEVDEPTKEPRRKRRESRANDQTSGPRPPRRINRPPTWDNVEGPLMSIPGDVMAAEKRRTRPPKPAPQQKKPSFWASLCCGSADDDHVEVIRHKKRTSHVPVDAPYEPETQMQQIPQAPPRLPQGQSRRSSATHPRTSATPQTSAVPTRKPLGEKTARPLNKTTRADSETATLLRYIPKTLSPQLTSTLLAELSKPISPHDDEGYIYIFWLTPDALGPAPSSTASTLLTPPSRPDHSRRTSDMLRQYSVKNPQRPRRTSGVFNDATKDGGKDTIFLKIGRASNVHRRMNEWTRQCGYNLSLVRYYPYVPSNTPSSTPSPQASPGQSRRPSYQGRVSDGSGVRKVPHAHRVERLIHLELGEKRVMKSCEACGKTHKEWFEVEASKDGVRGVDEVVKRWVEWAERANE
ncbi:meiotically up-regulated gene 113-domain-containing protein [Paraphoma chrysanthemicola]|uniref:Meiotically up-regulated gene 113-domain-containing protein n=1 Tax=Paraphoma chrysanthemicola TaxID=798071 RepID=A0A8K0R8E9_9PLEO|nr:meiotically up-regulated gene 113-domain-containing protein [Paraphoma chrysanthemicola]